MIRIVLFLVLGLMVSCKSPKNSAAVVEPPKTERKTRVEEVVDEVPYANDTVTKSYHLGVVRSLNCGYVVDITIHEGFSLYFNPTNLDSKFEVDGLRLKLKYRRGRPATWGCTKYGQIEIVEAFVVR
ncbi:hypothetical protein [Fluviicola sp.]|uniref:hypothetical protein n=1 Tax=Fluviicola sp. TaxID=1917219 RepID=UPI002624A89E|nr:hypothetical protein [Fluviicola sp.]